MTIWIAIGAAIVGLMVTVAGCAIDATSRPASPAAPATITLAPDPGDSITITHSRP